MPPDKKKLESVDGANASTVGGRLQAFLIGRLAYASFRRPKLIRLLKHLICDIYELEGLVVGEERAIQESELSAMFEPPGAKSEVGISSPSGDAKPIQTFPEASTNWGALAYHHVRRAEMALKEGDDGGFWRGFYAARRMELFGLEELGEEYLEMEAHSITLEAAGLAARNGLLRLDTPREEAIKNVLGDIGDYREIDGTTEADQGEKLTANRVGAAMHVLHEFYVDQRLSGRTLKIHLQSFIATMTLSAIIFLATFFIPSQTSEEFNRIDLLLSPISNLSEVSAVVQLVVLILIVVLGIMGASVSGLLSLSRALQRSRIPDQAGTVWFAVSRLTTGGVAALMLFLFLTSGIISIGGGGDGGSATGVFILNVANELSVALVFSLSFVAGFSERLLVRVVESVAGEASDATGTAGK